MPALDPMFFQSQVETCLRLADGVVLWKPKAERALRPLVVMRKITFGHRSEASAKRMAAVMTIAETAHRHGHRSSAIFLGLYTRPPDKVLKSLYAGA